MSETDRQSRPAGRGLKELTRQTVRPYCPPRAAVPRIAQYITMNPAPDELSPESRAESERWWRQRLTGLGRNEKGKEHLEGTTAKLTPLGRKLLGVEAW